MNIHGTKFSKSRGGTVDVPYFLSRYDPDALRFYLTAVPPETRDTEFSWEDFVERNNHVLSANEGNELVATWGNLVNRMLGFAYKRFDGHVPEPGGPSSPSAQGLDTADRELLAKVEGSFHVVGNLLAACKFRAALGEALGLAREANGYTFATLSAGLDRKAPWFQIKEDRDAAATTVYVILRVTENSTLSCRPSCPTPPSSSTSTWGMRASSSGGSTSSRSRRRLAPERHAATRP